MERPGNPFERAKAAGPTWEAREKRLFDELAQRADALNQFYQGVAALPPDMPQEALVTCLDNAETEAALSFSEDTVEQAQDLVILANEDNSKNDESETLTAEELDRVMRVDKLWQDPDVRFLAELTEANLDLRDKHERVRIYKEHPEKVFEDLKKRGFDVKSDHVKSVDYGTYDVVLTLKPGTTEAVVHWEAGGLYIPRTPFILLLPGSEHSPEALRHERRHNLMDSSAHLKHALPIQKLTHYLSKPQKKGTERIALVETIRRSLMTPQWFLDALHNEIIAELGNYERFTLGKGNLLSSDHLATAEKQVSALRNVATEVRARTGGDPERIDFVLTLADEVDQGFVKIKTALKKGFQLAEALGKLDEFHALTVILKPSQYRHLDRYLRYRTTPEALAGAEAYIHAWKNNERPFLFMPRTVQALIDIPTEHWSQALTKNIQARLETFVGGDLELLEQAAGMNIHSIRTYTERLKELCVRLGDPSLAETFLRRTVWNLGFNHAARSAKSGFDGLQEIYTGLTVEERSEVHDAVEAYLLEEFFPEDAEAKRLGRLFGKDVTHWPHWERLRSIGLGELVAPAIQNLQTRNKDLAPKTKKQKKQKP